MASLGLVATTNSEGAGKWTTGSNKWFTGKTRPSTFWRQTTRARPRRQGRGCVARHCPEISVVSFPELPEHGDVSDWLKIGSTKEQLLGRAETAKAPRNDYTLVRASDIIARPMDWCGAATSCTARFELLTGLPGMGKSQVHCQFMASRNHWAGLARRDQRHPAC